MPPNTRQRQQIQTNMTSQLITTATIRVKKAKEAVNSPDLFENTSEHIQEAWKELRRAYEATASDSNDSKPFPFWVLDQFEHRHVEKIIRLGYSDNLGLLTSYAPSAREYFGAESWRFILFFNFIEQGRARALNYIMKNRDRFSIDQLYEEVCRNRSRRIQGKASARSEFQPADFKACVYGNENENGNDAEFNDGVDEAEENEVENEECDGNDNPENGYQPPIVNTGLNSHESGYTAGHDDQEEDLLEVRDLLDNIPSRSIRTSTSALLILDEEDGIDADGEVATPITLTPHVEDVPRRRESSHEQSSSLDPPSGAGDSASIEQEFDQDENLILLKLEGLKAVVKTASETAGNLVKKLDEENAAYAEKAKQLLLNPDASSKDKKSAMNRLIHKVEKNHKRRKIQQDKVERRERLVVKLENPEFQVLHKSDARHPEAASANIRRHRAS